MRGAAPGGARALMSVGAVHTGAVTRGPDTEPSKEPSTEPSTAPDRAPESFAPATRAWFDAAFPGGPTPVQARAWRAIGRGDSTLVIAPTGSGKTLAAFLSAIDRLGRRQHDADQRPRARRKSIGVRVLYISPLKALGADVERNLERPLAGITAAAQELGDGLAPITVAMRSGDTPAAQRRRLAASPPDILITTPESLYLMLTSQVRSTLKAVETVIVDEIHSVAGEKRGTHLALSLERLDDLLPRPAQRIGLSATVSPREEVARFLGGTRPVAIIADEGRALPEVSIAVPVADMSNLPVAQDRQAAMERALRGSSRNAGGGLSAGGSRAWRSDRALRRALHGEHSEEASPAASRTISSIWPHIETAVLDQVLAHRTTVVFVNSRGLCERLTARLNEAYARRMAADRTELPGTAPAQPSAAESGGAPLPLPQPLHRDSFNAGDASHAQALPPELPVIAKAHHGSVSKEQRLAVEDELKSGRLRCVVATASLELGIDMGTIDLVLQVAPPPSVASGLQRVGRANHHVGGRPRGIIYPIQRTQIIDAAVASEGMRQGRIERTTLVTNALDVLAQQTVAAAAVEDLHADAWYATVRRAAPYRDLPRGAFDSVLELLAGGYATADLADFAPRLTWDRDSGVLAARPGAQRLAVGASGTIPDRGLFPVVLPEDAQEGGRRRVGELDEEMVNETSVGDVITLGTSTWRVREITGDRVVVDAAPGRSARLPFWHGEGPGRPAATGQAKGAFLRAAGAALTAVTGAAVPVRLGEDGDDGAGAQAADSGLAARLSQDGLDANARRNLLSLLREQRAATGALPSDTTLVLEHCRDESGAWRLIVHSPWGRRVHEPWAMAIRERARTTMGIEPQIVVADDGIVLQLPATEEEAPSGAGLVVFDSEEIARVVRARVSETALFAARFRECAARALLMPAAQPGRRTPLWLQRLKSAQLLQASRRFENFPIGVEAARECLQDVYDLPALTGLMERIAAGSVRVVEATTQTPSPFAGPLLFGYTGALLYQEDLPQAERSAHLLSLDPDVVAELMGQDASGLLDEQVVEEVEAELQRLAASRRVRADAEGVADLLRELGPLGELEVAARCRGEDGPQAPQTESAHSALAALEGARRAIRLEVAGAERWARVEDAAVLREALGVVVPTWAVPDDGGSAVRVRQAAVRSPLGELVVRYVRTHALITAEQVAGAFGLGRVVAQEALERLADEGAVMRLGGQDGQRWMAPEVFRRVRSRSLARAREAIRPVAPVALQRLVLERAGLGEPGGGIEALAEVLAGLEGVWLPAALWEEVVLPARVVDYRPAMLDELLASGEVVWQARSAPSDRPGRTARDASPGAVGGAARDTGAVTAPGEIAFFPSDSPLAPVVGTPIEGIEAAELWARALAGEAKAGSFEPVRRSLRPAPAAAPPRRVRSRRGRGRYAGLASGWAAARAGAGPGAIPGPGGGGLGGVDAVVACGAAWHALSEPEVSPEAGAVALIESLLDRYGVISRDIALAAGVPGGLTPLMPVLRRLEETGALLRGRFVEGQGPFQVAERETVEALRSAFVEQDGAVVVVDVKDPACLVGRGVPWPEAVLPAGVCGREVDQQWSAPPRRRGARVVLVGGRPVVHASERLRALTSFTADRGELLEALGALVTYERRVMVREDRSSRRVVESVNGVPAIDRGVSALLAESGLVRDPRGMRLGPTMQW